MKSGGPDTCCSSGVVIDPQDSNTLYVPSGNSALFKSTDGGANWHIVGSGLRANWNAGGNISRGVGSSPLAIDPRSSSTIFAATLNGIYRSGTSRLRIVNDFPANQR
jgi:hypothetical protein